MRSLLFWKAVVADTSNFLELVTEMLASSGIPYRVIGDVAVNAYAEPVLTHDLDVCRRDARPRANPGADGACIQASGRITF